MTIQVLFPHHWQTQPWKNGGGITHELARADDDRGTRWRLSIADVASDGPFSRFDGLDRIILMLEGKGFRLHGVGDDPQVINEVLRPFAFAGEAAIHCSLVEGTVRDFNVMSRRGEVSASLEVLSLNAERMSRPLCPQTFLFVVSGRVFAEINDHGYVLAAEQALRISHEVGSLQLSGMSAGCAVLLISLV